MERRYTKCMQCNRGRG